MKHDFESWVPKLSDRAVVLVHDMVVQERGIGFYKYWAEISKKYPSSNFTNNNGLGVLLWGSNVPSGIGDLVSLSRVNCGPGVVKSFFEAAGSAMVKRRLPMKLSIPAKIRISFKHWLVRKFKS